MGKSFDFERSNPTEFRRSRVGPRDGFDYPGRLCHGMAFEAGDTLSFFFGPFPDGFEVPEVNLDLFFDSAGASSQVVVAIALFSAKATTATFAANAVRHFVSSSGPGSDVVTVGSVTLRCATALSSYRFPVCHRIVQPNNVLGVRLQSNFQDGEAVWGVPCHL